MEWVEEAMSNLVHSLGLPIRPITKITQISKIGHGMVLYKIWRSRFFAVVEVGIYEPNKRYYIEQVAQLWQRHRAKLDAFSINVEGCSQNHAKYWIFGPPYWSIRGNIC